MKERSASKEHVIDLSHLLGEPTPAEADPAGEWYCFERDARKDTGGDGWADVWKRGCFAWEYKGRRADLDAAFNQLRQYAFAWENPLLIVSDMVRFHIRTSWTNSVSVTHKFTLDNLADGAARDRFKWAMSDPERLRPGGTRQTVTERAAATFAVLALYNARPQWLADAHAARGAAVAPAYGWDEGIPEDEPSIVLDTRRDLAFRVQHRDDTVRPQRKRERQDGERQCGVRRV